MSNPADQVVSDEDAMGAALTELREARSTGAADTAGAAATATVDAATTDAAAAPATDAATTDTGEQAAATTTDKPAADAKAATAATKSPEEQLAETQAALHRANSELGRVSALNRKYQDATQEAATLRQQLAEARKAPETKAEALTKLEQLAEQVKDFPELLEVVQTVGTALKEVTGQAQATATKAAQDALAPIEPLRRQHLDQQEQERAAADAADLTSFKTTYPTAAEVIKTDDFKAWLPKQSPAIQWAFTKGQTPGDALPVMDAYDAHLRRTGKPSIAKTPQSQAPAADGTATTTTEAKQPNTRLTRAAGIETRGGNGSKGSLPPQDDFDGSLTFFRSQRQQQATRA